MNTTPSTASGRQEDSPFPPARVLIADDQKDVLEALRLLLKGEGHQVESVTSPEGILTAIDGGEFDVVLMDLNYARGTTTGREGLDLLPGIRAMDSTLPVIVPVSTPFIPP